MTTKNNNQNLSNSKDSDNLLLDSIKVLSDLTRKDIERSCSAESVRRTESYNSNRYSWFLRKFVA